MAGWHHRLKAHEFGWTPGVGDGEEGLACCNSWGRKQSDTTEKLNWTEGGLISTFKKKILGDILYLRNWKTRHSLLNFNIWPPLEDSSLKTFRPWDSSSPSVNFSRSIYGLCIQLKAKWWLSPQPSSSNSLATLVAICVLCLYRTCCSN